MNRNFKSILLIFLLILVLTGCQKKPRKEILTYLGMEASNTSEVNTSTQTGLDDPDKPFGNYNIEDKLKDNITITKSEELNLYTSINKDIYIKILLQNPKKVEFTSVLINQVVYESILFEPESDFNNIIIKVNVGQEQGVNEYKLDKINYKRSDLERKLEIKENNLLKVGIKINLPSAIVPSLNVVYNEITIKSFIKDDKKLGKFYKLYLYDGTKLTEISELALEHNSTEIKDLNHNSTYQFAIVTEYDALDENGNRLVILYKKTIKTRSLVEIDRVVSGIDYLDFYISYNQKVYTKILSMSLYEDDQLIETLTDLNLREFNNLKSNKNYNIVIKFEYRYGDSETKTSEYIVSAQTKAIPVVEELTIMNTAPVSKSDMLVVDIKFNNPNNELIYSVIIDGEEIRLGNGVTTSARIEFFPKTSEELYRLSISGITLKINDEKISYIIESSVFDEIIFEINTLNFVDIYNENGEKFILNNQNNNLILEIDNPNNLTITDVILSNKLYYDFEIIDNNHIKIIYSNYSYSRYIVIIVQEIIYKNQDGSIGDLYLSNIIYFYVLNSFDTNPISTVDELKQMQEGYNYKLMNDIDLFGIEWIPLSFAGILDGDGHKISNYNSSENASCFFTYFTGVLKNIDFLNFNINSTTLPQTTPLILEASGYLIIKNCSIDYTLNYSNENYSEYTIGGFVAYNNGYLDVSDSVAQGVINISITGYGSLYFGGLVGLSKDYMTTFNNVQSNGEINIASSNKINVGGVLGNGLIDINNSTVNASIEVTNSGYSFIGGFIGTTTSGLVQNCTMNGSINLIDNNLAYKYLSGIGNGMSSIINCKNTGNININSTSPVYVGGLSTSTNQILISQCEMQGDITVFTNYLTLVGGITYGNDVNIDNCVMSGDMNVEASLFPYVAGIMVYEDFGDIPNNEIKNCQVLGNTTIKSSTDVYYGGITNYGYANLINNKVYSNISINCGSYAYIGGMVSCGYVNQFIENCSYVGTINVNSEGIAYVGGMIGYYQIGTAIDMQANNLYVNGDFVIQTNLRTYTGGLFGYIDRETLFTLNINKAKFEGSINAKTTDNAFVGGLIAHSGTKLKISNCEVNGTLKADAGNSAYTGGFVASGTISISKSLMLANLEVISNSIAYVGGFLAYNKYIPKILIEDTVMLGNITINMVNNSPYSVSPFLGQNSVFPLLEVNNCYIGEYVTILVDTKLQEIKEATIANLELINASHFYKNNLHFKELYWNYSTVDYNNKIFPKLNLTSN